MRTLRIQKLSLRLVYYDESYLSNPPPLRPVIQMCTFQKLVSDPAKLTTRDPIWAGSWYLPPAENFPRSDIHFFLRDKRLFAFWGLVGKGSIVLIRRHVYQRNKYEL
jgi:hypothetical protein